MIKMRLKLKVYCELEWHISDTSIAAEQNPFFWIGDPVFDYNISKFKNAFLQEAFLQPRIYR